MSPTPASGQLVPEPGPMDGTPLGLRRTMAYALSVIGLDVVARSTIRAMLPPGISKGRAAASLHVRYGSTSGGNKIGSPKNTVGKKYQETLLQFEENGWIQRGQRYILVKDRHSLLDYALKGYSIVPPQPLRLSKAIKALQDQPAGEFATAKAMAQRDRELAALKALMRSDVGGAKWSGRGSVQRVGPAGSGDSRGA